MATWTGVWRAALAVAWVAGWVGLCAWVVWFAHTQASSPRQEALRVWCQARVRFLHQDVSSAVARAQEYLGLMKVFGTFGPPSSSDMQYWGLGKCLNNETLLRFLISGDQSNNYSTGSIIMRLSADDRPTVETVTGYPVLSMLGVTAPKKDLYIVNLLGSNSSFFPVPPFTDLSPLASQNVLAEGFAGKAVSWPPISTGLGYVASWFIIPIFRPLPPTNSTSQLQKGAGTVPPTNGTSEQQQTPNAVVSTAWAGIILLEWMAEEIFSMLQNGTGNYSIALYDNTDPNKLIQIIGPDEPLLETKTTIFQFVQPALVLATPDWVEPFPGDLYGRTYEAHCRFEGAYPRWELVYAPMLLGLLVLLVAMLLTTVIAVLSWKQEKLAEGLRQMELCTAALEKAERSKSETVANLSHELRTPIIGMIGMTEELLESKLEEWQREDLKDAISCAKETVHLINRVLDLAKLQAGRLHLETLPFCLHHIAHDAVALAAPDDCGKALEVTCHVGKSVPEVLMGDSTRLSQIIEELTAHAMSNTVSGRVTFRAWCIPPAATPSHTNHGSHAPQTFHTSPAWHQLAACVRRFPPLTTLACLPQPVATKQRGDTGREGSSGWREGNSSRSRVPAILGRGMGSRGGGSDIWNRWETERVSLGRVLSGRFSKGKGRMFGETGAGPSSTESTGGAGDSRRARADALGEAGMDEKREDANTRRGVQRCDSRGAGTSVGESGGLGRLEGEVREWVEGACRQRWEDEWMVVMACEDTGGGIPPEEMRWVLDPHGDSDAHHAPLTSDHGDALGMEATLRSHESSRTGRHGGETSAPEGQRWSAEEANLSREQREAARPPWTPYPVRLLLSTTLVGEMRGGMAVLSDATTGTTFLLVLPMGGGETPDSEGSEEEGGGQWGEGCSKEGNEEECADSGEEEGEGECVAVDSASLKGMPIGSPLLDAATPLSHSPMAAVGGLSPVGGGHSPVAGAGGISPMAGHSRMASAGGHSPLAASGRRSPLAASGRRSPIAVAGGRSPRGAEGRSPTSTCKSPRSPTLGFEAEGLLAGVLAGQRVAVVDDNAVNRMVARRTLQGYGAQVALLCSGEDALQALSDPAETQPFTLLLLDLHMPGIDGFETARQIRGLESPQEEQRAGSRGDTTVDEARITATNDITHDAGALGAEDGALRPSACWQRLCIIALTADLDAGVKRACLEAGMDGAVRKPIVAHELLAALTTAGFGFTFDAL